MLTLALFHLQNAFDESELFFSLLVFKERPFTWTYLESKQNGKSTVTMKDR